MNHQRRLKVSYPVIYTLCHSSSTSTILDKTLTIQVQPTYYESVCSHVFLVSVIIVVEYLWSHFDNNFEFSLVVQMELRSQADNELTGFSIIKQLLY